MERIQPEISNLAIVGIVFGVAFSLIGIGCLVSHPSFSMNVVSAFGQHSHR